MKKVIVSIFAVFALAACSSHYDYYRGGVRYYQEGADCIYYASEQGNRYSTDIRSMKDAKKVVYRNTLCANLFEQDTAGNVDSRVKRQAIIPATVETSSCNTCGVRYEAPKYGCNTCAKPVLKRKYVIVAM